MLHYGECCINTVHFAVYFVTLLRVYHFSQMHSLKLNLVLLMLDLRWANKIATTMRNVNMCTSYFDNVTSCSKLKDLNDYDS